MPDFDWRDYPDSYKPLVDTGRETIPLHKYPNDLDFSKTIGGTTYVVKSHFSPQANESILRIVLRWIDSNTNVSE